MLTPKSLVLFIDAYDSFSNNIISLLETTLDVSVRTIKIDDPTFYTDADLHNELRHYAAVVCGPGPGHPARDQDVGVMKRIWRLSEENILPVFGICLGFQSLCLEFGGNVGRLKGPQHGMIRRVTHAGERVDRDQSSIFAGVGVIQATHYQSLCVDIDQDSIPEHEWPIRKWKASDSCPAIVPLAWAESDLSTNSDSGVNDARVLVAARHETKPFWALQYHPESICTNEESTKVIKNWFSEVKRWNFTHRREPGIATAPIHGHCATRVSLLSCSEYFRPMLNGSARFPFGKHFAMEQEIDLDENIDDLEYYSRKLNLDERVSIAGIAEAIQDITQDQIILESSNAYEKSIGSADVRGRYSIIALNINESLRFEYTAESNKISAIYPKRRNGGNEVRCDTDLRQFGGVWPFLAQYLEKRRIEHGDVESPFWGGFMGYTTYELGLETIGVFPEGGDNKEGRPDLSLAWITQSLVIDHVKGKVYIQELAPKYAALQVSKWMDEMSIKLGRAISRREDKLNEIGASESLLPTIHLPEDKEYESKVRRCQENIRSGDSYELCLTDQTRVTRPKSSKLSNSTWDLYRSLRSRQPAPFASYIRLGSATLISSSPERFLKWDAEGRCELRPMKGTVRKSGAVSTLAAATALLDVPKEKAENLMIVDLVRHDLHGVCGSGNVDVPRLMVVEEYKSVFQMISVVQGRIPPPFEPEMEKHITRDSVEDAKKKRYTGIDVLAASLPPGSMTGAPKKRSCEILQEIEAGQQRSLYSGVVGYMDVGGRGDWSVTIRSMFRWDDEDTSMGSQGMETWHIGAGGAVTALSTPGGEREEMQTKLNGTLGVFG